MEVGRVTVTNSILHQNFGDLIGTLTLEWRVSRRVEQPRFIRRSAGPYSMIYDDSQRGDITGSRLSDGPGSLNGFMGLQGVGVWRMTEVDDSWTQTGTVENFNLMIEPHKDLNQGITVTVQPGRWYYDYIDVPSGATNLTINATNVTVSPDTGNPLQLYVKLGAEPTQTNYDKTVGLTNSGPLGPGGSISIGPTDVPPLTVGRYWVGIYNPSSTAQTVYIISNTTFGAAPGQVPFTFTGPVPILDDAVTYSTISVPNNATISSVDVGLRVDHPRISDLVFHLISPDGTRVLLMENRGGTSTNGCGSGSSVVLVPNTVAFPNFAGEPNLLSFAGTTTVISNNILRLTPAIANREGVARLKQKQLCANRFDTTFHFKISDTDILGGGGGDGINFSVQNVSPVNEGFNAIGGGGGPTSVNVFFNTFQNWPDCDNPVTCDVSDNSVGVAVNTSYVAQVDLNPLGINMKDGNAHSAHITFDGMNISVWVDGMQVLANVPIPGLAPGVDASGYGWVGFDAWCGNSYENHDILDWTFSALTRQTNYSYLVFTENTNLTTTPIKFAPPPFVATNDIFYLPEQPMDSLAGQNAHGTWTLEIQDDRAGATNNATLVSWQLRFVGSIPPGVPPVFSNTLLNNSTTNIDEMTTLTVTNAATDADTNKTLTYSLFIAAEGATIDTNGIITWKPSEAQGPGTYLFTTVVTDNGLPPLSATNNFTVTVNEVNRPPVFLFPTNTTIFIIPELVPFTTNCIATDPDIPVNPLTFALVSGPADMTVSADGVIDWTPTITGTNVLTISVTDANPPAVNQKSFSVTNSFTIIVLPPPTPLTNGVPVTNSVPSGGGIVYYSISVPTNADCATNILLSATLPVNVWFNQNMPPSGTNPPDSLLITNATAGTNTLNMVGSTPLLMPGQTYYIGVQNTNSSDVTAAFEVDFHFMPIPLTNGVPMTNIIGSGCFVYYSIPVPTNAISATNTLLSATGPVSVWFDQNNLPSGVGKDLGGSDYLLIDNAIAGASVLNGNTGPPSLPLFVSGQTYYIGVQNTNSFAVTNVFEVDFDLVPIIPLTNGVPATNSIPSGDIVYYSISVPINANFATNTLLFADAPVNVWFNQTNPPVGGLTDWLMFANATAGTWLFKWGGHPNLQPGQTYYISVQNTNSFDVTAAFEVDFNLVPITPLTNRVPGTNISTSGFAYYSVTVPTNVSCATNILLFATLPVKVRFNQTYLPGSGMPGDYYIIPPFIYYPAVTSGTNVLNTGSTPPLMPGQTYYIAAYVGGMGSSVTNVFEVIFDQPVVNTTINDLPQTNTIAPGDIAYYSISVPTNAIFATNILLSATAPVNVWFNQGMLPNGTNPPDSLLITNALTGTSVLNTNTTPPLVPGQTYYIGVQNTNSFTVINVFEVNFDLPVIITNGVPATNIIASGSIAYYSISVPINVNYATNMLLSATLPVNVWFNQTNLPSGTNPPDSLFITNALTGTNVLSALTTPPLVPGQTYHIGVQNTNSVPVTNAFEVDFHLFPITPLTNNVWVINTITSGNIAYYSVLVPANTTMVQNQLMSATAPVNVWFNQNTPPSGTNPPDYLLIANASTGSSFLYWYSVPPLVLGQTYYIGVQNTNSVAVTSGFRVFFSLSSSVISGPTATGIGAKLQWIAPPDAQFQVEWATNISSPIVWMTNAETITSTDGMFTFTDPGSTNSHARFYRLLQVQ